MNAQQLTGHRVLWSQPGTDSYVEGTVRGLDAFLEGFVNVLWCRGDGSRTMVATVHASRCEIITADPIGA